MLLTPQEETHIITEIDHADPELTEVLFNKTSDELYEYIQRIEHESGVIYNSKNQNMIKKHEDRLYVVRLMYALKSHREKKHSEGFSLL